MLGVMDDPRPDFAALMVCDNCDGEGCIVCEATASTPRTMMVLFHGLQVLGDEGFDDAEELNGQPINHDHAGLFDRYPEFTWSCDTDWRRRAARAYDDLADDMVRGIKPHPRCPAEEMALWLAVDWSSDLIRDLTEAFDIDDLPVMATDYQWAEVLETLMPDLDVEFLFDPDFAGVEHPDDERNQRIRMGDYRAPAWFEPNLDYPPRDPGRGFRRPPPGAGQSPDQHTPGQR